jgi:predicted aspartyl protease
MTRWLCWALTLAICLSPGPCLASDSAEPPAEAVVGSLPFLEWPEINRVALNLAPEGARPFQLMLDTGASDSVLTPRYAKELGVSIRRARDRPYERETALGRSLQFWVDVESSDSASRTGWEYGLLGGTFLADYVLEVDFTHRRVRFIDAGRWQVPKEVSDPREAVLPLRVVGNRVILEVKLEGKPVQVMLDTGAPNTMLLSGAAAKRAGFDKPSLLDMRAGGVLGSTESHLVEADKLELGPFAFSPAPIELAPHGFYNQGSSSDSLLGYDVLSHFTLRIDYPHKRLWLRREDEEPLGWLAMPWPAVKRTGVLLLLSGRQDGVQVQGVFPESPAAKLGVQPGDLIELKGEGTPKARLEALLDKIEHQRKVTVIREEADGVRADVELGGEPPATSP